MANPLDTDAGSELFSSYETEFKLVQADLTQKLDQVPELTGEPRKAAINQAERALEEADELVILHLGIGVAYDAVSLRLLSHKERRNLVIQVNRKQILTMI